MNFCVFLVSNLGVLTKKKLQRPSSMRVWPWLWLMIDQLGVVLNLMEWCDYSIIPKMDGFKELKKLLVFKHEEHFPSSSMVYQWWWFSIANYRNRQFLSQTTVALLEKNWSYFKHPSLYQPGLGSYSKMEPNLHFHPPNMDPENTVAFVSGEVIAAQPLFGRVLVN